MGLLEELRSKLIARENFANFDVIKSQGDLENFKFQSSIFLFSPKDYRHFGMVNLMSAYFNVILIRDKTSVMGIVFNSSQWVQSVITPWLTLQFLSPSITSALASTLNVDFPVQNSFNLFVDS